MSMFNLQPPLPTSHRSIQQEFDQHYYDLHRSRVQSVQPSINSKPPKIYSHLEVKLKRLQLENDRLVKIENENRRLLKALVDTAERPSPLTALNDYEPKSLNLNQRLNSTIGLLRENEKIVNRLINVKPTFDRKRMDKEWADREKIMTNISRYRHPWRRPDVKTKMVQENDDEAFSQLSLSGGVSGIRIKPTILLKRGSSNNQRRARARSLDAQWTRGNVDTGQSTEVLDEKTADTEDTGQMEKE